MKSAACSALFDMDGTLVDSAPDIAAAINEALSTVDLGPLAVGQITPMLGAGAHAAVERALAACGVPPSRELTEQVHTAYIAAYEATPCVHTRLYPGCRAALERLHGEGWSLGVVTNKPHGIALAVMDAVGLTPLFPVIVGAQDGMGLKPAPDMLRAAMTTLQRPSHTVFIGDSMADVGAARAAGLPVILLSHGYTAIPARELGADAVIDHFDELNGAILALNIAT